MKGHGTPLIPIGEPATPANTVEWRQSLSINDGDIDKMATWDVNQTKSWLQRMGLSIFCEQFQQHQISGEVLPLLTRDELREMGINFVGPRAHLLMHINKLKRQYNNAQRNKVIWEGQEALYETPCEACCDYTASCCMPDPPSKYTLTNSTLRIGEKVFPMGKACRCCMKGNKINTVDLSMVKDVDSFSAQQCCFGRDTVQVETDHETCWMHVALGTAPEVIKMVRDAVEASQVVQRVNAVAT